MNKKLKLSLLALLAAIAAVPVHAQTNLLQSVSVTFEYYWQGPTNITATTTNYTVPKSSFGTKQLINILSSNGFQNGDVLVRATPVTNVPITVTNLVPVSTNALVITNESTSEETVSNYLILGTNAAIYIGDTNVTYGTNTAVIDGSTVTLDTNNATFGTNELFIGTNTTVTVIPLTNAVGNTVGTSNIFVINALSNAVSGTDELGTAYWAIYNPKTHPKLVPISTNVSFNIFTARVHDDGTNLARMHGENVKHNGVIQFGTTDEIRILVLSNSDWNIKMDGYAHGKYVPISVGENDIFRSQNYNWTGSGSGVISNSVPIVIDGGISEQFLKVKD